MRNLLDTLTIEEVIKYSAEGFELNINDGHVMSMVMKKSEVDTNESNNNER